MPVGERVFLLLRFVELIMVKTISSGKYPKWRRESTKIVADKSLKFKLNKKALLLSPFIFIYFLL